MATVQCRTPVTYNGAGYKPGDVFEIDEQYISHALGCCLLLEKAEPEPKQEPERKQESAKAKKASK